MTSLSELLLQHAEPSPYCIPRYVGHACGQGGAGFHVVLHSSPKSWHNQSEDHEVVVRGSSSRVNVIPGHLPAWKGEQRVNAPVVLGAGHACAQMTLWNPCQTRPCCTCPTTSVKDSEALRARPLGHVRAVSSSVFVSEGDLAEYMPMGSGTFQGMRGPVSSFPPRHHECENM